MTTDLNHSYHYEEVDCEMNPQMDWFSTCAGIAYGATDFTEKDRLEYNRIFEGL